MRNDGRLSENNRSGEGPRGGVPPHPRLPDATETEDGKSLGRIKVSRRVCGGAAATGHFSNGTMAAHKLCKLLSLRRARHPENDNYRRGRGSGGLGTPGYLRPDQERGRSDPSAGLWIQTLRPFYQPGLTVGHAGTQRCDRSEVSPRQRTPIRTFESRQVGGARDPGPSREISHQPLQRRANEAGEHVKMDASVSFV